MKQETKDLEKIKACAEVVEMRRAGHTFKEIGSRVGCSAQVARHRYLVGLRHETAIASHPLGIIPNRIATALWILDEENKLHGLTKRGAQEWFWSHFKSGKLDPRSRNRLRNWGWESYYWMCKKLEMVPVSRHTATCPHCGKCISQRANL